jgi:hypothetical protein
MRKKAFVRLVSRRSHVSGLRALFKTTYAECLHLCLFLEGLLVNLRKGSNLLDVDSSTRQTRAAIDV